MTQHSIRSEDRSRDEPWAGAWAETVPACFRSEAFAEDLELAPAQAAVPRHAPPAAARGRPAPDAVAAACSLCGGA